MRREIVRCSAVRTEAKRLAANDARERWRALFTAFLADGSAEQYQTEWCSTEVIAKNGAVRLRERLIERGAL